MKTSRHRLDVDVEELDRVIDATENGPLGKADRQKLKTTLHALVERLVQKRNTEKTNSVLQPKNSSSAAAESPESSAPAGHGRNAASVFTGAEKVSVQHGQLRPGDPCPECREGRVYRQKEPKTLIRIVGQAPLKATVFEMERLRCNACCEVFTAAEPAGVGAAKYDMTAVAMIALLKYGTGMPFNRMERLETQLGIPLPAATQWELMEPAAGSLEPIMDELILQAAQGSVVHNDDTGMRILKLVRNTDDGRTGTFTSGIVSIWREWRIALYFTGWKHAGENLADVLKQRAAERGAGPVRNWAGGAGYTILQGLRVGISDARGSYLDRQWPFLYPGEANPNRLPGSNVGTDSDSFSNFHQYDVTADRKRFIMASTSGAAAASPPINGGGELECEVEEVNCKKKPCSAG